MKLYPRKLHTVGELKKEKQRLLKQRRELDKEDLISFDDVLGSFGSIGNIFRKKKKKKKGDGLEGSKTSINYIALITDLLSSGFGVNTLVDIGWPLLSKFSPQIRKSLFKVSKEVLGGYAKWKAIEIGYRFVRRMLAKKTDSSSSKRRRTANSSVVY